MKSSCPQIQYSKTSNADLIQDVFLNRTSSLCELNLHHLQIQTIVNPQCCLSPSSYQRFPNRSSQISRSDPERRTLGLKSRYVFRPDIVPLLTLERETHIRAIDL